MSLRTPVFMPTLAVSPTDRESGSMYLEQSAAQYYMDCSSYRVHRDDKQRAYTEVLMWEIHGR